VAVVESMMDFKTTITMIFMLSGILLAMAFISNVVDWNWLPGKIKRWQNK
jgi:hypothetical protein